MCNPICKSHTQLFSFDIKHQVAPPQINLNIEKDGKPIRPILQQMVYNINMKLTEKYVKDKNNSNLFPMKDTHSFACFLLGFHARIMCFFLLNVIKNCRLVNLSLLHWVYISYSSRMYVSFLVFLYLTQCSLLEVNWIFAFLSNFMGFWGRQHNRVSSTEENWYVSLVLPILYFGLLSDFFGFFYLFRGVV